GVTLERGPAPVAVYGLDGAKPATVAAQELKSMLDAKQAEVADLASTLRYPEGHIPGAWQVVRSRLSENLKVIPGDGLIVFTAADERLALLAAIDAAQLTSRPVKVLQGGSGSWKKNGYPLEKGLTRPTGPEDDVRYRAMDHRANVESEIQKYLSWEVDLVNATETDTDFGFRRFA
ncbi:MAG: thiosulfate sulfurtransferase, partial [Betaproteobacteria bacterium]|nr:thiosulfate sulfurtransferase [Betaproteobacteria bacterium]